MTGTAAIIGGGTVGGGWAARFALMGWEVRVFDPDPAAPQRVRALLDAARAALPAVLDAPLPAEGTVSFPGTISAAAAGADWVQESVPERLDLKHTMYQAIQAHLDAAAIIASSTGGFTPAELQAHARRPGQIVVAHPLVPVYLLPMVELAGSEATPADTLDRAETVLSALGMYPLRLAGAADTRVAARLAGALWREALCLARDGVATTRQIDDAIRMGLGLRWAQMGPFDAFRVDGGAAAMRQAGPPPPASAPAPYRVAARQGETGEAEATLAAIVAALAEDPPAAAELDAALRRRDSALVAILRALKVQDCGAGEVLNAMETRLSAAPGGA